ncbi:hypothetical protein K493DRAFT_257846 [Basidiobolus meristosporus CBS 931.73]|uniref:Calcium permease family membrane transporter n=1 Tax=Basidiobolus meristosporus CBS 931.73 TaxID=1314790 RepID=A0A1Y1YMM8_9FUNG|nr:hypothetical protein K493DRAFT_257846 [Basidiobolus meristosporus CBS 931.73]|eukprot:ORX98834.1 hypothetical protein K493DRAFT_257846 [Basidiobolus meristosporus CBS 931.73]
MSKTPSRSKNNHHTLDSTFTSSSVRTFYTARTSLSPAAASYSTSPTGITPQLQNLSQMDPASGQNNKSGIPEEQTSALEGHANTSQSTTDDNVRTASPTQEPVAIEQQGSSSSQPASNQIPDPALVRKISTNTVINIPGTQSPHTSSPTTPKRAPLRHQHSKSSLHHRKSRSRANSRRNSYSSSASSRDSGHYKRHSRQSSRRRNHKSKYRYSSSDEEGDGRYEVRSDDNEDDEDDDEDGSDREMTLKDRQEAINTSHPFGLPLWKPALYKKSRSVTRSAYFALHSIPSPTGELFLYPGNILWTLLFGWWIALICLVVSVFLTFTPSGGKEYARVLRGLAWYLFWPFGRYVEGIEDMPAGITRQHLDSHFLDLAWTNSIESGGVYTRPRSTVIHPTQVCSDDEAQERDPQQARAKCKAKVTPWSKLTFAGFVYYFWLTFVITPLLMFVAALCWFFVISVPMAKLTFVLNKHLRRTPLKLHFKNGSALCGPRAPNSQILLCTYKAIGLQYYKYTYDGINILFINLMPVVLFVLFDAHVIGPWTNHEAAIAQPGVIFTLCLFSVIPLAYFIGMAVSSISAQSSLGMGAVINATFGSIVEIILYGMAIADGKGVLVEGSIIGSFLAGLLLMPGVSMLSGGLKKKIQKFNAKSAGVTTTFLIMSLIGAFTPTLFYQIYGTFELKCSECPSNIGNESSWGCRQCSYNQIHPTRDPFYLNNTKPLMYICAAILPLAYFIGLWFTLRTHVKHIYHHANADVDKSRVSLYQRLLQQIIPQHHYATVHAIEQQHLNGNGGGENTLQNLFAPEPLPTAEEHGTPQSSPLPANMLENLGDANLFEDDEDDEEHGGHDAPEWGNKKSTIVLLSSTVLFAAIAELLVDSVDFVIDGMSIEEKFLGITLFALVPNVTEFMNAISFAMYGNIALSLEIGSAYAVQVSLLQIPALVAFSAWHSQGLVEGIHNTFTLIFPRWDVITVLFSVFLLTYTYSEGKSNYFKGSILCLSYLVFIVSFFYEPPLSAEGTMGAQGVFVVQGV